MKSDIARLCLGSAPYCLKEHPQKIIDCAYEAGIRFFDTAQSYGTHWPADDQDWKIITKVKATDWIVRPAQLSAWALLAHEPEAGHLVRAVKVAGYKGKIGQSLYYPEAPASWAEVVQFPLNLADRRYAALYPRRYADLYPAGQQFHARSIFLQGKLLEMGYSVSDCLGYVLRQPVDYAIIGVNSVLELEEVIMAANDLPEHVPEIPAPDLTAEQLDPRTWTS